jgi:hypothetical protein
VSPMPGDTNWTIKPLERRVEESQQVLVVGRKKQDLSIAGTNTNSAPNLSNKSKVDQLEKTEERRQVEEAISPL